MKALGSERDVRTADSSRSAPPATLRLGRIAR
jgi:hypothetical protein